jgi:hypothetical protein
MYKSHKIYALSVCILIQLIPVFALASDRQGKIKGTGGVSSISGAGGGGITPWATLSSYASAGQRGAAVFISRADVDDFELDVVGAAVNLHDHFEVSYARQNFTIKAADVSIRQDKVGLRYKLAGDVIYDAIPQITPSPGQSVHNTLMAPTLPSAQAGPGLMASAIAPHCSTSTCATATPISLASWAMVAMSPIHAGRQKSQAQFLSRAAWPWALNTAKNQTIFRRFVNSVPGMCLWHFSPINAFPSLQPGLIWVRSPVQPINAAFICLCRQRYDGHLAQAINRRMVSGLYEPFRTSQSASVQPTHDCVDSIDAVVRLQHCLTLQRKR